MPASCEQAQEIGTTPEPLVVAEGGTQPDALVAEVLTDQARGQRDLLAQRHEGRGRNDGDGPFSAVVLDVLERTVAERVLLHVETRRLRSLDGVQGMQERAAADEQGSGDPDVRVHPLDDLQRATAALRIERELVAGEVRAPGKEREHLPDRGGLGVVADEDRRHPSPFLQVYWTSKPPSTTSSAPVTKEASSDARNAAAAATSDGCPTRPMGWSASSSARRLAGSAWLSR